MKANSECEELLRLRGEAKVALLQASRIRRFGHFADTELQKEAQRKTDALIKHLLAGHDGKPCPAGDRPIVKPR
jgi:hypothetical protein